MSAPYLLISDLHLHDWSAFSTVKGGVNSRLQIILDAIREAAAALKVAGGKVIIDAGDTFHVRGSVAPSVLNPVMDLFRELIADGFEIYVVPGNHDLEGNNSERVGNAVTALESLGVKVAHEPMSVCLELGRWVSLFPWFATAQQLCAAMRDAMKPSTGKILTREVRRYDAIIHAPIDRVLPHLPDHGLKAEDLAELGYWRVFAGHYHHHLDMGNGVYSIGALTHQTWGDIGSRAGYCLVYQNEVKHFETRAPKFVELTGVENPDDVMDMVLGNYVRVRAEVTSEKELQDLREDILGYGAAGVVIQSIKKVAVTRSASTSAGVSIESSIDSYVKKNSMSPATQALCLDILSEARAAE